MKLNNFNKLWQADQQNHIDIWISIKKRKSVIKRVNDEIIKTTYSKFTLLDRDVLRLVRYSDLNLVFWMPNNDFYFPMSFIR